MPITVNPHGSYPVFINPQTGYQMSMNPHSTFNINPMFPALSQFTFTFTNGTQTGRLGPSLANLLATYNVAVNSWLSNTALFNAINGIQLWTVPATGTYRIEAAGAQGSTATGITGGLGARMRGDFTLTQGEIIRILVGQIAPNTSGRENLSSSGGGGSFVVRTPYNTLGSILVIAGGGGGTGNERPAESNGNITTTGGNGSTGTGGVSGNGGNAGTSAAGSGGGFLTDGQGSGTAGGLSYLNGGLGGDISATYSINGGGFGGGGSVTSGGNSRYGGGGGYSGGGSSSSLAGATTGLWGGGGGSFNSGVNQLNTSGANSGNGFVTITLIG
jgi:hypothetical protein